MLKQKFIYRYNVVSICETLTCYDIAWLQFNTRFIFSFICPKTTLSCKGKKTVILLKRCSLSAGCHLYWPWSGPVGLNNAGTVRNHSSAWSYKSFLVWVEVRAPGAFIKEMPQWRSVPEIRKPIRIIRTTILSIRYCLNMLLVEDGRGGERVLDREIKGYVENAG